MVNGLVANDCHLPGLAPATRIDLELQFALGDNESTCLWNGSLDGIVEQGVVVEIVGTSKSVPVKRIK